MSSTPLREVDRLYAMARSLEAAAQAASTLALDGGASPAQLQQALGRAETRMRALPADLYDASPLGEARRHLHSRREICRAVSVLALSHGVERDRLAEQLSAVTEAAARLYSAQTLSDLGFAA